jgi:hypothetical protein
MPTNSKKPKAVVESKPKVKGAKPKAKPKAKLMAKSEVVSPEKITSAEYNTSLARVAVV